MEGIGSGDIGGGEGLGFESRYSSAEEPPGNFGVGRSSFGFRRGSAGLAGIGESETF